jgi:hypothetical protein
MFYKKYKGYKMKIFAGLFLLTLFIPMTLLGAGFDDLTGIFVTGDIGFIKFIMTAIQKATTSSGYTAFVSVTTLVAIVVVGIELWLKKDLFQLAKGAVLPLSIIGFLNYTTTVHIEDIRIQTNLVPGSQTYSAGEIPSLLAAMYGASSAFELTGANLSEDALNAIDTTGGQYSTARVGYMTVIKTLSKTLDIATDDNIMDRDADTANYSSALKRYAVDCVLGIAVPSDTTGDVIKRLKNPDEDIVDAISPSNIGLSVNDKLPNGTTCESFYNDNILNKELLVATKLYDSINKQTKIDLDVLAPALNDVGAISFSSSQLGASALGQQKGYLINAASIASLNRAIVENNNNLQTGLDYANAITAQSSISSIQLAGIGAGKWFATIAPYIFHILKGVVFFYGIFVPPIAIMLGASKGLKYMLSYFFSLIGFAAVGIGMAISGDIVTYFAKDHFVELVSSLGSNPFTMTGMKQYYMDMATYAGVAGFLGSTIALIAPSLILKGQASAAISAVGSMSGMYKGGVDNAMDVDTKNKASQEAYERELNDVAKHKLGKAGFSLSDIPSNMGAADYYQKIQEQANKTNAGWGAYNQRDNIATSAEAERYRSEQKIGAGVGMTNSLDSNGGGSTAYNSGVVQGTASAATMEADSASIANLDSIHSGTFKQAAKKLSTTAAFGDSISTEDAMHAGDIAGASMANADKGTISGVNAHGMDNYLKGIKNQAAQKASSVGEFGSKISEADAIIGGTYDGGAMASKITGAKRHMSLNSDWRDDLNELANKDADSKIGTASAIKKGKALNGDAAYITSAEGAELANLSKSISAINAQGGVDNYAKVAGIDSELKSSEQLKILGDKLKEGGAKDGLESSSQKIASGLLSLPSFSRNFLVLSYVIPIPLALVTPSFFCASI